MAKSVPSPEESVSCNVVPLLDVMFLLLIFLMLGSDMSVRETADVSLAVADAAKEQPEVMPKRYVTLNVFHREGVACAAHEAARACRDEGHWLYSMQGKDADVASLPARLAAVASDASDPPAADGRRVSGVTLSIRCDKSAPYAYVQEALMACATAGIHRTEVAAAMKK